MKKTFLLMAAMAAMILASCGGNSKQPTEADAAAVSDTTGNEIVGQLSDKLANADTTAIRLLANEAQEHIKQLQAEGKLDEAKAYAESIRQFVEQNADELKNAFGTQDFLTTLKNAVDGLTDAAKEATEQAADAAKSDAETAVEATKARATEAADAAVNEAQQKAEETATKAREAAATKASQLVNKANESANEAATKANSAIRGALGGNKQE